MVKLTHVRIGIASCRGIVIAPQKAAKDDGGSAAP
jgi:hypothetical protein